SFFGTGSGFSMFGKRGSGGGDRGNPQSRPVSPTAQPELQQEAATATMRPAEPGPSTVLPVALPPQRRDTGQKRAIEAPPLAPEPPRRPQRERSESYYDTKSQVFSALIDTIDLSQLAKLAPDNAREEIRDIVNDIIAIKNFAMSISEQEELL